MYQGLNYYLKDGEEFEFEFFNGTQDTFLAGIELNGKPISSKGLVLKPGERVYLERYLDDNRRFKFETYEVEDSREAKEATAKNGSVKIKFWKEKVKIAPAVNIRPSWNDHFYKGVCDSYEPDSVKATYSADNTSGIQCSAGSMNFMEPRRSTVRSMAKLCSVETGRVQEGSISDQQLTHATGYSWEYFSYETNFKILPESALKEIESKDLRVYCTNCGKKRGHNDKFCSTCGTKY
jgi:hypothetical protein